MSSREAAIFIIISDEDQTIKEMIVKEQERIMTALNFRQHVEELEIKYDAREYFERVFLDYEVYYYVYAENPFMKKVFDVKRGQVIIAIFAVNSAGCWEGLQVLPAKPGLSSILYYSERETIEMPS
jgi:hypothetical protein